MEKLDDVNLAAIRRTLDSAGWTEIQTQLNSWIGDLKNKLAENAEDDERHRGSIMALRNIIHFEDYLIDDDAMVKNSPQLTDDPEDDPESHYDETRY